MLPRKKISELKARYELEPTLNDVFVEGDQDKRILDKAYNAKKEHRPVYSISGIDIPTELLLKWNFTEGNRQRVLALRNELALPANNPVRFLIDADLDRHLDREMSHFATKYTKYTDIEGAFLFNDLIYDLVMNAGRSKISDWHKFFQSIEVSVKGLFSIRLALDEGNYNVKMPSWTKSLVRRGDEVFLDLDEIVGKFASSGLTKKQLDDIRNSSIKWLARIEAHEARAAGRGHDYIEILSWAIKAFGGNTNVASTLDNILILVVPQVADDIVDSLA